MDVLLNRPKLSVTCLVAVAAALALPACGSDSSSSTSGGETNTSVSGLAAEARKAVEAARKPLAEFPGPDDPAGAPPADKSVAIVKILPAPFPNNQEAGVEAAADAVGWTTRSYPADGTPHGMETALAAAIASRPDAIVLCAMPVALLQPQLRKVSEQGIETIALSPGLPGSKPPAAWNVLNLLAYDAAFVGEVLADWVVQDSPDGAHAIALSSPEFVSIQDASKAFQQEIKGAGADFAIDAVVDSPVTDAAAGADGVNRLATPMRGNKEADYMYINSESWVNTFLQASQAAGRSGEVTGLGADGDVSAGLIKDGAPIVMMGSASKTWGWYAVDALIRKWNDKPQQEYFVPLQLVDAQNADSIEGEGIEATYDVAAEWESLWR